MLGSAPNKHDDAAADDVVQESWLGVVRGLSDFEERSSLRPAVVPKAFAADGRWASAPTRLDSDPESGPLSAELRARLLGAVEELSPDQRAVITLRDLVGLPARRRAICSS